MSYWKSWSHVNTPKTVRMAAPWINGQKWPILLLKNLKFLKFPSYPRESPAAAEAGEVGRPNYRILAKSNDVFWKIGKKPAKKAKFGQIWDILGYSEKGVPRKILKATFPECILQSGFLVYILWSYTKNG